MMWLFEGESGPHELPVGSGYALHVISVLETQIFLCLGKIKINYKHYKVRF